MRLDIHHEGGYQVSRMVSINLSARFLRYACTNKLSQ